MSPMPYYVSPEQLMKDRADFARKGIARGRSIIAIGCSPGILVVAENPSSTLRKVSELYDRIAFAAVGKYNEFESLRKAGVRIADLTGFSYAREDVTAKAVANAYAQALGAIFTQDMKPYEVEVLVAQVGATQSADEMYRIFYDGTLQDEGGVVAMGGHADTLMASLSKAYRDGLELAEAITIGTTSLQAADPERTLNASDLEAALLERNGTRRVFRRLADEEISAVLASSG